MSVQTRPAPAASATPAKGGRGGLALYTTVPRSLAVVVFLGSWQLLVPHLSTALIPLPTEIVKTMIDELRGETAASATLYESFGITLARLAVGLAVAMVLGTAIGVAMGVSRSVDAMLRDLVYGLLAMPYVVWALIAALWFGFTFKTPVIVVVLASIAFVITNVAEGVRAVPKDLVDMAQSFSVSRNRVLRQIILPSIMPFMFAAFRYALSLGWKALAVAEVFGSSSGAGWVIRYWFDSRDMEGLFAYLGFFVIFAILMDYLVFNLLARRVFRWRPQTQIGRARP
jgi:ABC-type nitrate/sulfonate/bicarbonate transport system permease component